MRGVRRLQGVDRRGDEDAELSVDRRAQATGGGDGTRCRFSDTPPEVTRAYKNVLTAVVGRGKAEEHVTRAVAELREAGDSWNLIGPALGVLRQSARENYGLADDSS